MTEKEQPTLEMWDAILWYLKKASRVNARNGVGPEQANKLLIEATDEATTYTLLEGSETIYQNTELVEIARFLKVYLSWEED